MAWETPFLELGITPGSHFDADGKPLPNPDGVLYPTMDSYLLGNATERTKTMVAMESGTHNWLDDMARDNPHFRQYSLTAQGGSKRVGFYISGNYQNNEGVMKDNSYERLYLRAKLNAKLSENVELGINVTPQYITQEKSTANFQLGLPYDNFMPIYHNEFTRFLTRSTYNIGDYTRSLHFDTGTPTLTWEQYEAWKEGKLDAIPDGNPTARLSNSSSTNPISKQQERSNTYDEFRISAFMSLKWDITKKLYFNTTANSYYKTVENNITETEYYNRYENRKASNYIRSISLFTNENTLNFKDKIGDHGITALAGFTEEITNYNYHRIVGSNIPKGMPLTLNNATLISQDGDETFAYPEMEVLLSALFRVMYDYKGRYLFSGSVRADGSSIFAEGKRWGYFPSLSAGWRLSEEPLMDDVEWLSNLKLRTSYGLSGNNSIAKYSYLDRLVARNYSDAEGQVIAGLGSQNLSKSNPDITWEKTNQVNAGLDIGILKNRVTLNLDCYYTLTDDLLLQQTMPVSTGFQSVWQNVGRIKNQGVEMLVNIVNIDKKDLYWGMNFNFSQNQNKVIDFGGQYQMFSYGKRANEYLMQVGLPVSNIYGWKTDGIFNSLEELNNSPHSDDDIVGSLRRVDLDGDGKITEADKTIIGNPVPKLNWGFGHEFKYKGFDVSLLFEGLHDFDIYNLDYYNAAMRDNIGELYKDAYVDEFHGSKPTAWGGVKWEYTDHILYDGSYIALRNLSLGYTLNKKTLDRLPFTRVRVYFSAANLYHYIYGDYCGINPEFKDAYHNSVLKGGEQSYTLPLERTFTFGLDLKF